MPYAIDEEKINDPSMQVMDPGKPPLKQIPFQAFPKMLYLHPKNKTKEHQTKIVASAEEQDAAMKLGWRPEPHIPQEDLSALNKDYEFVADTEPVAEQRRGPGRPPKSEAA